MFWKKKELKSDEYEILVKKISNLSMQVDELHSKLKTLWTEYDNLRGKFNRKLSGLKKEEEQTEETENNLKPFNPFI